MDRLNRTMKADDLSAILRGTLQKEVKLPPNIEIFLGARPQLIADALNAYDDEHPEAMTSSLILANPISRLEAKYKDMYEPREEPVRTDSVPIPIEGDDVDTIASSMTAWHPARVEHEKAISGTGDAEELTMSLAEKKCMMGKLNAYFLEIACVSYLKEEETTFDSTNKHKAT